MGLSLRVLADGAGVSFNTVSQIERGVRYGLREEYGVFVVNYVSPTHWQGFDKVRGYLMREAKGTPAFEPIKEWSKAGGRLKATHLEHLVLQGLAARSEIPQAAADESTHDPTRVDNPQILISKQLYGDLVHWGDKRGDLAAYGDQFMVAWERLNALEAALALGYIYIGFAAVIAAALGRTL
jgi:transcriptional regulator with XRE-family HTH domain